MRVWLPGPQRCRGPAPTYSREQIADAAIRIADDEGLPAVTMRKIATALGTGAMSLYRYVENKEAVFELMADRLVHQQGLPERSGEWRTDLRVHARRQRALLLDHPWLLELVSGRPPMGPNLVRELEAQMSILDELGLDIDDMFETIVLVDTWVTGFVRNELAWRAASEEIDDETWMRAFEPYVRSLMDSGEFPYFTRVVTEARQPHVDNDTRFERGLDRVLAGIEATLPRRG
ncbi:DNA-binding transcriptional regulator, AcrR family [Amycolatopsis arida]|uniref:DNA-binding transcriptional regulator, AcrR family n=1 Tax=Amycolatopsis arida TaxID=587909 RepID=A0A1I5VIG7_9PSEU|nr:TetR/AcrR family transcriptional regulator [Amycolatopsis arida]TDX87898.1 AcrR family transcriptional regulator [Amycolatopsis arida]SFQ07243.1 DNA-binding transcriptional regulator, AcrR family [Amycolatopsis arida]